MNDKLDKLLIELGDFISDSNYHFSTYPVPIDSTNQEVIDKLKSEKYEVFPSPLNIFDNNVFIIRKKKDTIPYKLASYTVNNVTSQYLVVDHFFIKAFQGAIFQKQLKIKHPNGPIVVGIKDAGGHYQFFGTTLLTLNDEVLDQWDWKDYEYP